MGVTISGLDVAVGLNQRLPLLHHRPQLVSGQPHPVEAGQAVLALNFLKDLSASFSFCKSARETSYTRPFSPSEAILVPWVLFTSVLPTWRTLKREGALISYQSFLVNGSTTFFLAPFFPPIFSPLFLPTAILLLRSVIKLCKLG